MELSLLLGRTEPNATTGGKAETLLNGVSQVTSQPLRCMDWLRPGLHVMALVLGAGPFPVAVQGLRLRNGGGNQDTGIKGWEMDEGC